MVNSNLKYIFRLIWKNKMFSFVNILSLSIGLACSIIIFLFIEFELTFDDFYKDKSQIYRVVNTSTTAHGVDTQGSTSFPLGYSLRNDFPEYNISTIYLMRVQNILLNENVYKEKGILYIDTVFADIFSLDWIMGSPQLISDNPKNVALTESIAHKFFGDENPIGKTITFSPDRNFQVAGIVADMPLNSSLKFSIIVSLDNLNDEVIGINFDNWGVTLSGIENYFKIPVSTNIENIEKRINRLINDKYIIDEENAVGIYELQSLADIHLSPEFQNKPLTYTTSITKLWIFIFIGLIILSIAGVNFINLATAQGLKRTKEVGIRKVLGVSRLQLNFSFIKEYAFISFLALIIAAIIVEILMPSINNFLGDHHDLSIYNSRYFIVFIILLYVFINLITSLYPSLVISKVMPINALKGGLINSKQELFSLRNLLLVFQFAISIALIIGSIVIKKQINYINNKDLGYSVDNIIDFTLPENSSEKISALTAFLNSQPGVTKFGFGMAPPSSTSNFNTSFNVHGNKANEKYFLNLKPVDTGYYNVFDLKLIEGEWLDERVKEDSVFRMVASEKFCELYGFESSIAAINKRIEFGGNHAVICGVVRDFHTNSLRNEIAPTGFINHSGYYFSMFVKIESNRMKETTTAIENFMISLFPTYFIEHQSVKENLNDMYTDINKTSKIITVLSALAILIASLGLFALVSYMIVQKVKEIGVRKVLGASLSQVTFVLIKKYLVMILISSFIAIPLAWYFMNRWLNEFTYRIDIEFWIFLLAIFIVMVIAMVTIIFQVIKTSRMNPVDALKYE